MNKTLGKFRKRNIQANISHFVLVIFVVAVSVCLISGLFISHLTFERAVDNFYTNSNLPSLWITADKVTEEDESFFAKYDYGKRYCFDSSFSVSGKEFTSKFIVSDGKISQPYIVEGDKGSGCYVNSKFAERNRIGIDYSRVGFDYSYNGETKRLEFNVIGSLAMAEDLLVSDDCMIFIDEKIFLKALSSAFDGISEDDLSQINYNQILITSDVNEADKQEIENYYRNSSSNLIKMDSRNEIQSFVSIEKELNNSKTMLYTFPILFVIISILVIVSTISQMILKERYNVGLLKSLGVSNKELLSNYSGYGAFICFVGAVIGFLISPLIVPNITFEAYDKIFNLPRAEVKMFCPYLLVLLVLVFSCFIGYFSAFFVCLNLTKYSPKECMSQNIKVNLKSKNKVKKTFGLVGSTFRNMKINLSRTIMSGFAIFGSSLLLILGFGIEKIFNQTQSASLQTIDAFSKVFKLFSILLFILVVLILIFQIFKERYKEMAMLRIHGESYVKIWLSVYFEMLFISLIGFILSCLVCQPVMILLLKIFGIGELLFIDFLSYLKTFLFIFGFVSFVSVCSLLKVYKLDLVSAIKFSE